MSTSAGLILRLNDSARPTPRPPNAPTTQAIVRNSFGMTTHVSAATTTTTVSVIAVRMTTESIVIRSSATAGPPGVPVCHVDGSV